MNENLDNDNRRSAYRYEPSPLMEPRVSIVDEVGRKVADSVLDINARGARLSYAPDNAPAYKPGQDVTLVAQAPGLDGCVDIPGRIVFSALRQREIVVGLVFTTMPDVDERADGAFFSVFNRRSIRRTHDPDEGAVAAKLVSAGDSDHATPYELTVLNHSEGGLGFIVDKPLDDLIRDCDTLELTVRMPGEDQQRALVAEVRHRAVREGSIYYGCRFADAA